MTDHGLNELQQEFITWNAERMGLSEEESLNRFLASQAAFPGGHRGGKFSGFCGTTYTAFLPFISDEAEELEESYKTFSLLHFLRMLAYKNPPLPQSRNIVRRLANRDEVMIIDYGCGLAQRSFWFVQRLQAAGVRASLTLVDFPTLRRDFLTWKCAKDDIPLIFIEANGKGPAPALPKAQLCIATEFFEHVHAPERYFEVIDHALEPGGWLLTNIADHHEGYMHVTPNLAGLRKHIDAKGYTHVVEDRVLRKS